MAVLISGADIYFVLYLCSKLLGLVVYMLLFARLLIEKVIPFIKSLVCTLKAALTPFCRNKPHKHAFSFL